MGAADGVAGFIDELSERWELELGEALGEAETGPWAATRSGGRPVVLALRHPDDGLVEEVRSLLAWDGGGIVELIDHDPRGAMLLERARPGTPLQAEPDEGAALEVAARILERLWIPAPIGIETVRTEVARWARTMPLRNRSEGGPIDRSDLHQAVALLRELGPTQRDPVLLHGDLHLGNILAAEREPWLAVDPRPLVGEREFDVAALLRPRQEEVSAARAETTARVQQRFDVLAERLDCDRERLKGWAIAITVDEALWTFELDDEATGSRLLAACEHLRSLRT